MSGMPQDLETRPVLTLARPLEYNEPKSIEFMNTRLALSGLKPEDLGAYPIALQGMAATAAFVIPYTNPRMYRIRHDRNEDKYTQPPRLREVWVSPKQNSELFHGQPVIYIIEGELKAAKFVKQWPHLPVFGIGGCHNALQKTAEGAKILLPELQAALAPGTKVVAIFDGDVQNNPNVQVAAHALSQAVKHASCEFNLCIPPLGKGVDDWLVADDHADLKHLVPVDLLTLDQSRKYLFETLKLQLNDAGNPILNELNCKKLLANRYKDNLYVDRRIGVIYDGEPMNITKLEHDAISYIQGKMVGHMPASKITTGVKMVLEAQETERDLLQEMLRNLEWDGVKRLDTWGSGSFETDFPAYANEWGRILMTGLGLRILEPGTKCDHACILVGAQGIGKSTFFEELATFGTTSEFNFYHACTNIGNDAGDSGRTQAIAWQRAIIVDLAEGVIFETKKAATDVVKQRISQVVDEYRPLYTGSMKQVKRGFIFVGTTNREDQLGDHTGNRRFLVIKTTKITKIAYPDKLQLLAEVTAREHELRATDWYKIRATVADAPEMMRKGNEHIKDVQQLMNSQFSRGDAISEHILSLLESDSIPKLLIGGEPFISAKYIANTLGEQSTGYVNLVNRSLSGLSTSPMFPYTLTHARKRASQIDANPAQRNTYGMPAGPNEPMISGYVLTKKEQQ